MYSAATLFFKYLKYRFIALNGKGHGAHSPFVYAFIKELLNNQKDFKEYASIESVRKKMLLDNSELIVADFGAGSKGRVTKMWTVKSMAAAALKPKKFGQLMFRMVAHYGSEKIVELGTSLGITTSYLAAANPNSSVFTLEGASEVAAIAQHNFQQLGLENVQIVIGNFDHTLAPLLNNFESLDFVFVDGNHRYEPTLQYFQQLKPKMRADSILIFDDIHWSKEMEAAWEIIKEDPAITVSIDLFFIGIVFFRKENRVKQHFTISF
jgi:predicted O-methyltransferase YrrM